MKKNSIAKRYAKALFSLVCTKDIANSTGYVHTLSSLADIYDANEKLQLVFLSPVVSMQEKEHILQDILTKIDSVQFMKNFCYLLLHAGRISLLRSIFEQYEQYYNAAEKRTMGIVTTAYSLDAFEQKELCTSLQVLGKNLLLEYKVERSLLGGFVLQIEDFVIDASLRNRLETIRESIIKGGCYAN